jgi:hypothetical protein
VVSTRLLQWFGLLGAPAAWTAQHVFGYAITEAGCDPGSRKYGIPIDGWTAAATAAAAAVAVLAGLAALRAEGVAVETGVFGARMAIELVNDGPVTIVLE